MTLIAFRLAACFLSLPLLGAQSAQPTTQPARFEVTFDPKISATPFTGRVYVTLHGRQVGKPPGGPNWFNPDPFFSRDVRDWKPGTPLIFDDTCLSFPAPLSKIGGGDYYAQAVMDFQRGDRISYAAAEGNGFSRYVRVNSKLQETGTIKLAITEQYHVDAFRESEHVRLVEFESKLLSKFHGQPIRHRAAVVLPSSYARDTRRRYPVIYEIPGFGGNIGSANMIAVRNRTSVAGIDMLYVVLDPSCYWGHHVFADSANNGPRGQALIEELIPHIEQNFRAEPAPGARFVTGHSSGGWSSLWLQVRYPEFFGGVWSTAPDPVDFSDFQQINLYSPGVNMFTDERGRPRPVARRRQQPTVFYRPFSDMEVVMGHGGQLQSFEAVFGPRGDDGAPAKLWDRKTGRVNPAVAKAWEPYDIRLRLERNWKTLGPKLAGKIHVYMGSEDTFYLDGATILLKESLAKLGSDAVVEIFPDKDHSTLMTPELRQRIAKEMADTYQKLHKAAAAP
jgi:S-formylglutathione hydrolase FrmB